MRKEGGEKQERKNARKCSRRMNVSRSLQFVAIFFFRVRLVGCACVYAYRHTCIQTCMHADMHAYRHTCIQTCVHEYLQLQHKMPKLHTCMYVRVQCTYSLTLNACAHACARTICLYIAYIHAYACTLYINTYMYLQPRP